MPPHSLIILHTDLIHGNVEGLTRLATLVALAREEEKGSPVLYFDARLCYGPQVVRDHAAAARCPLLLANMRAADRNLLPDAQAATILSAGPLRLGVIGELAQALDFAVDRECGAADWVADVLGEALEDYLATHRPVNVRLGRLEA
jgi:2',3'-cyclic-nucleotide 2'-phosphodiesterase (5'-nucleotidase family)